MFFIFLSVFLYLFVTLLLYGGILEVESVFFDKYYCCYYYYFYYYYSYLGSFTLF